jgi:hypothetical protein
MVSCIGYSSVCRSERRTVYATFATAVSMCLHLGQTKVSSSWPGRSGSIPNSRVAVPQSEQFGRLMESEYGVAGGIIGIGPLLIMGACLSLDMPSPV